MSSDSFGSLTYNTLIAYILPGILLIAALYLAIVDFSPRTATQLLHYLREALPTYVVLGGFLLSVLAGLVVDATGHALRKPFEAKTKNRVYDQAVLLNELLKENKQLNNLKDTKSFKDQRNMIIDATATTTSPAFVYSRRNEEFIFYEAHRGFVVVLPVFFLFAAIWTYHHLYLWSLLVWIWVALLVVWIFSFQYMKNAYKNYLEFHTRLALLALLHDSNTRIE